MFEIKCTPDEVVRAFLLADRMKHGPFDHAGFQARVSTERAALASVGGSELIRLIDWKPRRELIPAGQWCLTVIDLDLTNVWPKMGEREWARGNVGEMAAAFRARAASDDRIWDILPHISNTFATLPLIAVRGKGDPVQFHLDDGSHWAVAYYLAGFRQAFAFVGRVPDAVNYLCD